MQVDRHATDENVVNPLDLECGKQRQNAIEIHEGSITQRTAAEGCIFGTQLEVG
jgi:hypothetical protein